MNLLDDLFFKYHADKTPRIKHHYSDVYYELFKDRRETIKKVLEIGTAEGASLFAWRDFFPNATIYGAEIDQKRVDMMQWQDRIEVYKCDQASEVDLINLVEKTGVNFDLVIDDGSHKPEDQLKTCQYILTALGKDVIYVIEDVDDASTNIIVQQLRSDFEGWGYQIEVKHVGTRHDDRLIIVRHRDDS